MLLQEGFRFADGDRMDRLGARRRDGLVLSPLRELRLGDHPVYTALQNHSGAAECMGSSERSEDGEDDARDQYAPCKPLRRQGCYRGRPGGTVQAGEIQSSCGDYPCRCPADHSAGPGGRDPQAAGRRQRAGNDVPGAEPWRCAFRAGRDHIAGAARGSPERTGHVRHAKYCPAPAERAGQSKPVDHADYLCRTEPLSGFLCAGGHRPLLDRQQSFFRRADVSAELADTARKACGL